MNIIGEILEVDGIKKRIGGILWNGEEIRIRVKELAREIADDYGVLLEQYPDKNLVLVGILNGVVPFLADLLKELSKHLPIDRLRYDTLAISSYGRGTSPTELRVEKDLKNPIAGDIALIVEDIIDTGYTAVYFKQLLVHKGAFDVRICSLLIKATQEEHEVDPDYIGFKLKRNLFVVGYGLDWADLCRFLTSIAYLEDID
ncbi:MAG TPA: hypoxanthine phosphoribosyltransferase [Bacteroidetes bacterium]|nr:hypoxanthine phosphoribosyltransferase [Bacteroidota bacterium]